MVLLSVVKLTGDVNRQTRDRWSDQASSLSIQTRRHMLQRHSTQRYVDLADRQSPKTCNTHHPRAVPPACRYQRWYGRHP